MFTILGNSTNSVSIHELVYVHTNYEYLLAYAVIGSKLVETLQSACLVYAASARYQSCFVWFA